MKKTFFTLLVITFTIQGYSQTSQQYFQELEGYFSDKEMFLSDIQNSFMSLSMVAEWNSGEHANMGQQNLSNNWSDIRYRFDNLGMIFNLLKDRFFSSGNKFMEIGNILGNFDGTYGSLSGLPTLFDGSFSSLSGTPTTLAGYGIGGDLQINSVLSESGYTAISINPDGEVNFYYSLQLDRINSPLGSPAISIDLDGNISFENGLRMGDVYSGSGSPAFFVEPDGNVNFANPLKLQSVNSYVGNPAISINADGDVGFENGLRIGDVYSGSGNPAFFVEPDGNVNFANPLKLQSVNSYVGNPAISINADGDVGLSNDLSIEGDVVISSDKRLKANIISLGGTLAKLLQIDGKSYTMKKDESEKQKIGLLAQDIEKVFPELVSESSGIKSVNYQGLVPVLINALKEQEEKIKFQERKLLRLESLVQDLIDNQ